MGMLNVTMWDFDKIEPHNIPNQIYTNEMIGWNKTAAMQHMVKEATGLSYDIKGKWNGQKLEGLVFSCVDSMKARKDILESMGKGLFIETRMGVYHGQIYTINPKKKGDVKFWHSYYTSDDVVEEKSACGTSLTIGATANMIASYAVWQGIKYMNKEKLTKGITVSVKPYLVMEF